MDGDNALRSALKYSLIILFLATFILGIYLFKSPFKTGFLNYSFNIANAFIYLIGGSAGLYFRKRLSANQALYKSVVFLSFGLIMWATASLVWSYYNIVLNVESPYPSFADVFYLAFTLFASMGVLSLLSSLKAPITAKNIIESAVIMIFTYITIVAVIAQPTLSDETPYLTTFFDFVYPLSDAFIFAFALIAVNISSEKIHKPLMFLLAGLLLQVVADLLFSYRSINGIYWNGDFSDMIFCASGFVLSASIISLVGKNYKKSDLWL